MSLQLESSNTGSLTRALAELTLARNISAAHKFYRPSSSEFFFQQLGAAASSHQLYSKTSHFIMFWLWDNMMISYNIRTVATDTFGCLISIRPCLIIPPILLLTACIYNIAVC
jgi:hypothetical protein